MIINIDGDTGDRNGVCEKCSAVGWTDAGLCERCETIWPVVTTIKLKDHPDVDCYGEWKDDSNCEAVFDDEWIDNIYCNDDDCKNWTEVVKVLAAYAKRCNTTLIELSSC